jgi:hypothetical protein
MARGAQRHGAAARFGEIQHDRSDQGAMNASICIETSDGSSSRT